MGFKDPTFPAVDPHEFLALPLRDRIKTLSTQWAGSGFGTPYMVHTIYILKLVVFYGFLGVVIATTTSGLSPFTVVGDGGWWNQPIVYQKLVMWTLLVETIGIGGSWGPLAGKAKPMTGGILFWAKRNTIRLRPFTWVPGTAGDRRTPLDIGLYLLLLASYVLVIALPGVQNVSNFSTAMQSLGIDTAAGLVRPALFFVPIVLLILMGLRDKTVFLAARSEQYIPPMLAFAILPLLSAGHGFTNMIIALKLIIGIVWIGAGISKLNEHFVMVIPPMVSNAPSNPFSGIRKAMYRNYPEDLRPSGLARFMAHGPGTVVEIVAPLILLFSSNHTVTLIAGVFMCLYHLFIISTFPLAVPLEWNLMFSHTTLILFLGFPADRGYALWDMTPAWLALIVAAALMFFPILGNLRPDKISFLPSMRQYGGNWASAIWAFAPGAEEKLNRVTRSAPNQVDQFIAAGYPPEWAEITLQMTAGWRSLHSQGRGLFSVLHAVAPDIDQRSVREAEFLCNSLIGFNFGEGHLHNEDMIKAVQDEAGFEPGEVLIVWVESQPIHKNYQCYKVIDPALGVVEEGTWVLSDLVDEQPWLPNGPAKHTVTWSNLASRNNRRPAVENKEKTA
ncbi:DUF3556 domain-containing protein [Tsukamurella pseudospumae]|uniref:DUF3556 domain-containing protein n=1 Tax=Tsukamurella pseudospumae TaxID=239498 RepID=A0A137ZZH4_9ACTN|nr:DUF3556 domain-containing protein [Tsukamurella pseudospumae]KXP03567.1 hypothetical protein AXK60_17295 [Tsukamurella pseudospumae]